MQKTLVLIRHCQRDAMDPQQDNGLTEKGHKQARRIQRFFQSRFSREDFLSGELILQSSPKLRCVETLQPLSSWLELSIERNPLLNEEQPSESFSRLTERVREYLHWWKAEGPQLTVVSSHGDWLPLAVHELVGTVVYFKKGGWLEMDWLEGQAHVRWYVPTFKYF